MGNIEDITRAALREREVRKQADEQALAIVTRQKNAEKTSLREQQRQLANRIVRQAVDIFLKADVLTRGIPGDDLVRVSRVRRRFFLSSHTVSAGPELAAWQIGSAQEGDYFVLSDGRLAIRVPSYAKKPGLWVVEEADIADMMKELYLGNRIPTLLALSLSAETENPFFDDDFCKQYLSRSKMSVRAGLAILIAPSKPKRLEQTRRSSRPK